MLSMTYMAGRKSSVKPFVLQNSGAIGHGSNVLQGLKGYENVAGSSNTKGEPDCELKTTDTVSSIRRSQEK